MTIVRMIVFKKGWTGVCLGLYMIVCVFGWGLARSGEDDGFLMSVNVMLFQSSVCCFGIRRV